MPSHPPSLTKTDIASAAWYKCSPNGIENFDYKIVFYKQCFEMIGALLEWSFLLFLKKYDHLSLERSCGWNCFSEVNWQKGKLETKKLHKNKIPYECNEKWFSPFTYCFSQDNLTDYRLMSWKVVSNTRNHNLRRKTFP